MKRKLEGNSSKQQNIKRNHFDFKIFTENDIYINIFKYLCFENNFNRFYLVCKDWCDKFINSNNRLWKELSATRWCELNGYTNLFSPTSKYFTIPESKSNFIIFYDGSKRQSTPKYVYDGVQFGKPTITYDNRARNNPPVQYLIRNRNRVPKSWHEIFKERYIKENITREYYKLHLQDYSNQEDKRSNMRRVKSISSIPSLNKSIYTNIENTKIIPILDSVIYSDLVSQRDNYFHCIDNGMEQIDYMLCRGSIMNLNGDIVEFSFRQLYAIEGDRYPFYIDPYAHIQFGKYYHVIPELFSRYGEYDSSQYPAYYQFINEITKLINGNTSIFSNTDIEQLISYIIPTYAYNNQLYQFYPLSVENNITPTNDIPTSTNNGTTFNNSNNNPNITGNITIFSTIIKFLSNDNEFNRLFLLIVINKWVFERAKTFLTLKKVNSKLSKEYRNEIEKHLSSNYCVFNGIRNLEITYLHNEELDIINYIIESPTISESLEKLTIKNSNKLANSGFVINLDSLTNLKSFKMIIWRTMSIGRLPQTIEKLSIIYMKVNIDEQWLIDILERLKESLVNLKLFQLYQRDIYSDTLKTYLTNYKPNQLKTLGILGFPGINSPVVSNQFESITNLNLSSGTSTDEEEIYINLVEQCTKLEVLEITSSLIMSFSKLCKVLNTKPKLKNLIFNSFMPADDSFPWIHFTHLQNVTLKTSCEMMISFLKCQKTNKQSKFKKTGVVKTKKGFT
ncbi:hypothetical protein DLAC_01887 [Tieghemostelium lacteum]|uniref:F-box domain-containing protein n=1 Tax=Tieghemostelium lacteum TaxID=361077 RepID=A0A152A743_TIELA|nr:hypothetical protein DLAC_01887 [Tieghemostelium lacteum]|eukprot:KYR01867.1 hypothetical protein DLAC_01887 [Tieghemostelium lacteum]